ncbi:MAG TPA: HEAT repeat domain-containing protein [Planctomycetota bacterium]|nr:HEAT repeat domain-containing protein [Planctomycetota bacterium]
MNRTRFLERARDPILPTTGPDSHIRTPPPLLAEGRASSSESWPFISGAVSEAIQEGLRDGSLYVRSAAAYARGKIGGSGALQDLRPLLADPSIRVRELSALGLGFLGGPRGRALLEGVLSAPDAAAVPGDREHARAFAALGLALGCDPAAVPALEEALRDEQEEVRCAAARALGLLEHRESLPALEKSLREDRSASVRAYAATALGRLRDAGSIPALLDATGSTVLPLRRAATLALGEVAPPSQGGVVARLIDLLGSDADRTVRGYAALSLGQVGGRVAEAALLRALATGPTRSKSWVAIGLGILLRDDPSAEGRAALLEGLRKRRGDPCLAAAYALAAGLARASEAEGDVRTLARSTHDPLVRFCALDALVFLGWSDRLIPDAEHELARAPELPNARSLALTARLAGDRRMADTLLSLARGRRNVPLAVAGAFGLGYAGDASHLDGLASILADERAPSNLRAAAAFSIGTLSEPRRWPLLVAARWGEEVTEDRVATMREFRDLP